LIVIFDPIEDASYRHVFDQAVLTLTQVLKALDAAQTRHSPALQAAAKALQAVAS
jgi:hypothetical protein